MFAQIGQGAESRRRNQTFGNILQNLCFGANENLPF
jgi:hypothetical protein